MADVGDFVMACHLSDKVYLGWGVELTELVEAVIVVLSIILVRIQISMFTRVFRASIVPKPDIESCLGGYEGWRFFLVQGPGVCTREKTMLEEHWFRSFLDLVPNMEDLEVIPICCYNSVLLEFQSLVSTELRNSFICIRVYTYKLLQLNIH